ncbi:MAG: DUF3592 domain-containing protein [Gloeomargarita sp. SKYG116]|nr:DUF3592 domain-containing protein [Gloeomargarita sp. SKYG116]MCS7226475.1 DUF3592 domain-containing protein [Gloeomargarita sp. SKYB31]MDW8401500.1 DUF3592 domain-containing protein [Gloeomargarita sp. SKYGB_i_bin116]
MTSQRLLGSILALLMGAGFTGWGLWEVLRTYQLLQVAVKTSGRVIDLEYRRQRVGRVPYDAYYPVVEFVLPNHQLVRFTSQVGNLGCRVGDTVPVLYHPQRPQVARLAYFRDLWGVTLAFLLVGVLSLGVGIWLWR